MSYLEYAQRLEADSLNGVDGEEEGFLAVLPVDGAMHILYA